MPKKAKVSKKRPPAKAAAKKQSTPAPTTTPAPKVDAAPTHEQIAARAKSIWELKGCPIGQDERNWLEAEEQIRLELGPDPGGPQPSPIQA